MSRVLIGVCGLQHPQWDEHYYPADIPADWKLAFYANDFTAIVLPEAAWRDADIEEIPEWLEDIDKGFRIYLRVTGQMPDPQEIAASRDAFGVHLAGFFIDREVEIKAGQLESGLTWLTAGHLDDANARRWAEIQAVDTRVNAVVINREMDKRALRYAFEAAAAYLDQENDVLVLYDVERPTAQELKDLRILLELMAIA